MSVPVLVVTLRPAVAEAFRPGDGDGWTVAVESPTEFDAVKAAPLYRLAVIDFTSVQNAAAMGRRLRRENPELEFIAIVGEERAGVAALRIGAVDYLPWPFRNPGQGNALLGVHVANVNTASLPDLGRFRLIRRLGIGGMAQVFLAEDRAHPGNPIALKQILQGIAQDPEFVTMFMDEARISAVLDHPNIVRVVDFGNISGAYYLALEYVPGRNLAQIAREHGWKLPIRLAAHICAEIATALEYAHARKDARGNSLGIIHRDVNPPNILLSDDGRVLLADFGVAKARQRQTQTMHGAVKGKLEYLSPEQSMGAPIDGRSDLFSLGSVLYLLLTGVQPFSAEGPALTLMKIRDAAAPPPSTLDPRIPRRVDEIVARALARDPKDRYATGGAFAADLRALIDSLGTVTREEVRALAERNDGTKPVVKVAVEPEPDRSGSGRSVRLGPKPLGIKDPLEQISEPIPDAPPLEATAVTPHPPTIPPEPRKPRPTASELILYESSSQLVLEDIGGPVPAESNAAAPTVPVGAPARPAAAANAPARAAAQNPSRPPAQPPARAAQAPARAAAPAPARAAAQAPSRPAAPSPVVSVSAESSAQLILGESSPNVLDAVPTRVSRDASLEPPHEPTAITPQPRTAQSVGIFDPTSPSEPAPEPTAITPQPRTAQSVGIFDPTSPSEPAPEPTAITPHPPTKQSAAIGGVLPVSVTVEPTAAATQPRSEPPVERTTVNPSSGSARAGGGTAAPIPAAAPSGRGTETLAPGLAEFLEPEPAISKTNVRPPNRRTLALIVALAILAGLAVGISLGLGGGTAARSGAQTPAPSATESPSPAATDASITATPTP